MSTCNEKAAIARRVAQELAHIRPSPPALRIFDAGMGDATVLSRIMRSTHRAFPTVPLLAVAKEISLEDVRLGLEKMPDRFYEHPATVLVITNLNYAEAPRLMPRDTQLAAALNWQEVRLTGNSAHEYAEQIEELGPTISYGWQTKPNAKSGNPNYVRPSVLDHLSRGSQVPARQRDPEAGPHLRELRPHSRLAAVARAHVRRVQGAEGARAADAQSCAAGGRLLAIQSCGRDPALEIIQKLWPGEEPFKVDRHALLAALKNELGRDARDFQLTALPDDKAIFRYEMHTLPSEISDRIGTSTLFAAWNAAIYVNQIEDERLEPVVTNGAYLQATQSVLQKYGGLWFNDETFTVTRRKI